MSLAQTPQPTWQIIYEIAKELNKDQFKLEDILTIIRKKILTSRKQR